MRLFTVENHQFFMDFKDRAGPDVWYYSEALGRTIKARAFEAFGNFIYGLLGVLVDIDSNILRGAAWYLQEGGTGAEDNAHVELGMDFARRFLNGEESLFSVYEGECGE